MKGGGVTLGDRTARNSSGAGAGLVRNTQGCGALTNCTAPLALDHTLPCNDSDIVALYLHLVCESSFPLLQLYILPCQLSSSSYKSRKLDIYPSYDTELYRCLISPKLNDDFLNLRQTPSLSKITP